ncbi:thermonuclease family protein [Polynucleobacter kasalickyi]|uniref:Endonuclease YncB, thermonuclease family n=1 Tax=Polynucleobacter kasalickyi TaxID=1938817 RepID=A0A1W1ZFC8_9BURK|nr:thermonuclease family protein [Polynucleobacter kasalickyi]SMC47114.1 Endonuclease YncB, thermonuclease family [Polynucleobacter kasalickyi]
MTSIFRKNALISILFGFSLSFLSQSLLAKEAPKHQKHEIIVAKVIGISDGDTITLLNDDNSQLKIRLAGIDCPEKNQAFGNRAKRLLSEKVFGNVVRVEIRGIDRYNRTLGIVRLGEEDINEYLIHEGVAWHYKHYAKDQPAEEAKRYDLAQEFAKKTKKGLWIQENPTPPWEFREQRRKGEIKPEL